jgi:predicted flap endonuclease-1-like 5' DNA nuclease
MDINTTVVVSVNGFLIIFFIYALLYVFRITPSNTIVPQRPEIRKVIESPLPEISEVVEPPRPEISEVTKTMEPGPEVSEVIEPILEVSEVTEVMEPSPEISEVMEPPIPEVTEAMKPPRPEISEVTEVMEPSPEVSEIIEPILEASEDIEPPRPEASEVTEPPGPKVSEVIEQPSTEVIEVAEAEVTEAVELPKSSQNIINVEGIGLIYAETLKKIGIETTDDLLLAGTTPQDREELAKKTGVSPNLILEWVNLVDLLRIKGVGEEYSDLLEEAGVDTVVELSKRNPEKLYNKMKQINEEKNLVNRVPFLSDVFSWVEQARALPRKVEY